MEKNAIGPIFFGIKMKWNVPINQGLTKDIEDHGQIIKNKSKMKIGYQEINKIFLYFLDIKTILNEFKITKNGKITKKYQMIK